MTSVGDGLERMEPNTSPQLNEHFDVCSSFILGMLPGKDGTTEVDIAHSTEAVLIIK